MTAPAGRAPCSVCGRETRFAKPVCSRCLLAFGPVIAALGELPARSPYPKHVRRAWPSWQVCAGHSAYNRGARDALTRARENEYQRRRRRGRLAS